MTNDLSRDNANLYLYNIFDTNEYISYPCLNDVDDVDGEYRPLSTYYYEAIILVLLRRYEKRVSKQFIRNLIRYKKYLERAYFIINRNNINVFREIIFKTSKIINTEIYRIISNDNITFKYVNESLNWSDIFNQIEVILLSHNKGTNREKIPCVAIAIPLNSDDNYYFALSGSSTDYIGSNSFLDCKKWSNCNQYLCNVIKDLLDKLFYTNFIDCHLSDKAVRYTKLTKNQKKSKRPLKHPIKLVKDFKHYRYCSFKRYYSCSEKKIINKIMDVNLDYLKLMSGCTVLNILTKYEILVLSKPCNHCLPALVGCNNIKYCENNNYNLTPHKIIYDTSNKEFCLV